MLCLTSLALCTTAQVKWTCKDLEACDWDKNAGKFVNRKTYTGSSLFVVNDTETICEVTQPNKLMYKVISIS